MERRKRSNPDHQFSYDVAVADWAVHISFNDYAYHNIFRYEKFQENISLVMKGRIESTLSKKCKEGLAARVIVWPGDYWYNPKEIREDCESIGNMDIMRPTSYGDTEDTIYFRVGVPTKSYEAMLAYLSSGKKATVTLAGTELFRRKGEVYYLGFQEANRI